MTSSNGNIFRVTGPSCGEFTGPGEFPAQRPVTRSFDVFFDLRPNERLSKQPREAGDLRRHRGHYGVSVMLFKQLSQLGIFRVRWDIDLRQFVSNLILIYIVKWKWESVLGSFIKFLDFNDIWLICMFLNSICSVDTIGSSTLIDLCRCIGEWIFHRPQTSSFGVINSSFLSMNLQPVLLLFCISYKWRNRCPKRFVSFGTFHIAK